MPLLEIPPVDRMRPIGEVAEETGILPEEIEHYGRYMAKLKLSLLERLGPRPDGRLVLVTAMTPTKAGEGKTTVAIGLSQALNRTGRHSVVVLREPSLGPMFGTKGVGTGGGRARVVPTMDINLHFTGDLYAVASANNLAAAVMDNHITRGNELLIDPNRVVWRRCLDVSDRGLRSVVTGIGPGTGVTRTDSFTISAASEVMAMLCMATDIADLERRLGDAIVAYTYRGKPIRIRDLHVQGSMAFLLKDAIRPNLVQTVENTAAIVHGGPFANIAHGTASLISIRMARGLADYPVVEAGFGSELGAEKFFNIVARAGEFGVAAAVVVASARALRYQGGVPHSAADRPDPAALERGLPNLARHLENVRTHGVLPVIALNLFGDESGDEIEAVRAFAEAEGVPFATVDAYRRGGEGALELAERVVETADAGAGLRFLYDLDMHIEGKIRRIVGAMYGVGNVVLTGRARERAKQLESWGFGRLPVCMAKSPFSLCHDPKVRGVPDPDLVCTVQDLSVSAGAGFIVAYTENVNLMPGLPAHPIAERIFLTMDGSVGGI